MPSIDVALPRMHCSACSETESTTPLVVVHINQIDEESRASLGGNAPAFVATKWEPPIGWLIVELHITGSKQKAILSLCPVCRLGDGIIAKGVIEAVGKVM